jgi:hypothetical protein
MPHDIEKDLLKCEQSLYQLQSNYGDIARTAAQKRYVYDLAWAEQTDAVVHRAIAAGEKMPTVAVIDATVTQAVKTQMEEVRQAEADLEAAKKLIDTTQAILSSVQTRAKLVQMEMSLAR